MKKTETLCLLLLLSAIGCEKNEERQRVSYRRVLFTVDLLLDNCLENLYTYKIYTGSNLAGEYIDAPGVLVFNNGDPMERGMPFVAYDMRCPYEDRQDVTILPNGIEAVCPVCTSKYELIYGSPKEGPSKARLQDYCVSWSGASSNRLLIRNCN
jgi:nitrite reductase/ring-hydroxylating ferredoxin subunit